MYGKIVQVAKYQIIQEFGKKIDLIPFSNDDETCLFFEISFDEFARHVVVETI